MGSLRPEAEKTFSAFGLLLILVASDVSDSPMGVTMDRVVVLCGNFSDLDSISIR